MLVDGQEEYEVEKVLNSKLVCQHLHYVVKWKGYPNVDNSWIPVDNVHSPILLDNFHCTHPSAPKLPALKGR